MSERLNVLELASPAIRLAGYSVAGEETVVAVPELDVMFDIGKAPRLLLSINHVCLSHGHMDHSAGLAYYFWQRDFQDNPGGTVLLPAALAGPVHAMLRAWAAIEGHLAPYSLQPMRPGDRFEVRRGLFVEAFEVVHGRDVPALGFVVLEQRHKLRPDLVGLTGPQIVELKKKGQQVTEVHEAPQVAYLGDSEIFDLTANRLLADARILVAECTFFEEDHRTRAKAGFHMHLTDLPRLLEMSRAQAVVLTHVTRRTGLRGAREAIAKVLSAEQLERVHFLMERQRGAAAAKNALADQGETPR